MSSPETTCPRCEEETSLKARRAKCCLEEEVLQGKYCLKGQEVEIQ